jgi:hypothetical protein
MADIMLTGTSFWPPKDACPLYQELLSHLFGTG